MKLTCNFEEMRMQLIYNNYKTIGPNIEVPMVYKNFISQFVRNRIEITVRL